MANGWSRRAAGVAVIAAFVFSVEPGSLAHYPPAPPVPLVFGPVDVVRTAGKPVVKSWTIKVDKIDRDGYTICIANGGSAAKYPPVTSAKVTLNGEMVFKPSDFKPQVTTLSRQVALRAKNTLTAEVEGKPGSGLTLAIFRGSKCVGQPVENRPPVITSTPITTGVRLTPYFYQVVATDPDNDALIYSLTSSPGGMSINPSSGLISWLPPNTCAVAVTVRVVDSKGAAATQSYSLTIKPAQNGPPVITSTPITSGVRLTPYSYQVVATDPDNDALTYSLTSSPGGMSINPGSGLISWLPPNTGAFTVAVRVVDSKSAAATQSYSLTIGPAQNGPPVISSTPATSGTLLTSYAYQVLATDPDNDLLTFSLTSAPEGMTIDQSSGLVSWLPPGTGSFNVVVRAVDPSAAAATQAFALTVVRAPNRPPFLTPIANRRVPAGVPFTLGLSADDPDPGDTVSFLLNSGPPGAAISGGQAVTWTPTLASLGLHPFSVSARDSAGAQATGSFSVEVVASNGSPVLDALGDVTTPAGSAYQRTLSAIDPNPGDALTFALLDGPAGLSVSAQGALTWTPSSGQLGDHRVSIRVADNGGLVDAGAFTIAVGVAPIPQPPLARDDRYAVRMGATLTVPPPGVLSNDEDPAGLPLNAVLVAGTTRGSLALGTDGAFTYTPDLPAPGGTEPTLAFAHTLPEVPNSSTYTQPVVADLDGDDRAEVVYLAVGTFATRRLVAVHGDTGATYWSVNGYQPGGTPDLRLSLNGELSVGDLDHDGSPEILMIHSDDETARLRNRIVAFNASGSYRWTSADILDGTVIATAGMFYTTVADLEGDGVPEILSLHKGRTVATPANVSAEDLLTVFNRDGSIRWTLRIPGSPSSSRLAVADIDVDGATEIVIGGAVVTAAGSIRWNIKPSIIPVVDVAVANLDDDPFAEIVYKDQFNNLSVHEHTGVRKWGPIRNPTSSDSSGIAIGDVDGDGLPEILVGQDGVEVWSRSGVLLMEMNLPNGLLGYGGTPTIFDLNGDGRPEVIYNGQTSPFDAGFVRGGLYVFDGASGALLHSLPASRGGGGWPTSSPVIADVNGDGSAEIVTGGWSENIGIRVFTAANGVWSNARPIWGDQSYHITNINPDGTIPARAAINWLTPGLNNFRIQASGASERVSGEGDRFTYVASNATLTSNVATASIDILPPNTAPLILSTPPARASRDIEYLYAVRAVDPDAGEVITYSLPVTVVGMTIDAATGLVRWTPTAESPSAITAVVRATDSQGQSSSQSIAITLAAPVTLPDVVGQPLASATASLGAADVVLGTVTLSPSSAPANSVTSQEPLPGTSVAAGSLVNLVVSSGPAPVAVPYLIGKSEFEALGLLNARGLGHTVVRAFSDSAPAGRVFAQDPAAATPLVPGSVQLSVSAGSGLTLRLQRSLAPAGGSIAFSAVAYDLQLVESPAPPLNYTVVPVNQPAFGALPTLAGNTIVAAADTRGAFRIIATDPATGRSTSETFAITFPLVANQRSMNEVFAGMSEAANDMARLTGQARTALALNDTVQMRSLLDQMVRRWRLVDVNLLHLSTPFLLPQGFYPTPAELSSLGLVPTGDDLLLEEALRAVRANLDAWTAGLRETSTSLTTLGALADAFNASAARAASLRVGQWGVIKTQPLITILLSESIPDFFSALMDELSQTVANATGPGPGIEMSSLAELSVTQVVTFIVEKGLEQASPIHRVRDAMLGHAAWSAAAVMAASQFREKVQGQPLTAVVAGGSLSFHTFLAPLSFVEADLDPDYPDSAVVVTIGPDQIDEPDADTGSISEAVSGILSTVRTGNDLGEAMMKVYDFIFHGKAKGVAEAVGGAFQRRPAGYRGCLFSSSPTCGQLVYDFGFKSVYTLQATGGWESFAGLPVPILFLVFDRSSGTVYVDTPVFLPRVVPLVP